MVVLLIDRKDISGTEYIKAYYNSVVDTHVCYSTFTLSLIDQAVVVILLTSTQKFSVRWLY